MKKINLNEVRDVLKGYIRISLIVIGIFFLLLILHYVSIINAKPDLELKKALATDFVEELKKEDWFNKNNRKWIVSLGEKDIIDITTEEIFLRINPFYVPLMRSYYSIFDIDFYSISYPNDLVMNTDIKYKIAEFIKKRTNKKILILEVYCAESFGFISKCTASGGNGSINNYYWSNY